MAHHSRSMPPDGPDAVAPAAAAPVSDEEARWLRQALECMPVGFCLFDAHDRLRLWNARFVELWRVPEHLRRAGAGFDEVMSASDAIEREHARARPRPEPGASGSRHREFVRPDGRIIEVHVFLQNDGTAVALHEDVTERRGAEDRIAWLARHDPLTGLANRSVLQEELEAALAEPGDGVRATLLYIDLDRFKCVNDTHGHAVGDELLRIVADRLRGCCREPATVARIGGDEFAVVLPGRMTVQAVRALGARVVRALSGPYAMEGLRLCIGASLGVTMASGDACEAGALLHEADSAMYRAKAAGRGTVVLFEPGMATAALDERDGAGRDGELRDAA